MADGVRADHGADTQVSQHRSGRERQCGGQEHGGTPEVVSQPSGGVDRDKPDRTVEQHPHPPMQPFSAPCSS
jgi:hypothetical protein